MYCVMSMLAIFCVSPEFIVPVGSHTALRPPRRWNAVNGTAEGGDQCLLNEFFSEWFYGAWDDAEAGRLCRRGDLQRADACCCGPARLSGRAGAWTCGVHGVTHG